MVVKSIDRLGRNYAEILRQCQVLTKERAVDIVTDASVCGGTPRLIDPEG